MARTKISWADFSWNPIIGCSKISAGCTHCYAERQAYRLYRMGQVNYGHVTSFNKWSGDTFFVESALTKPLHWHKPRKIFVVSMGDLFHESVPFEWIDRVFAVMALCPQHEFKVLTKRVGRMREYCGDLLARTPGMDAAAKQMGIPGNQSLYPGGVATPVYEFSLPLPNVHLGVTVENQENVGRIADLIQTPAAKRFVSFEPLLEDVYTNPELLMEIDYCFIGGESGPKARLCAIETIDELMGRCMECGVKIHVKQIPLDGKCNKNIDEWPEEFQVREI